MGDLHEKIKAIEKLVCENFDDLEIDDSIEETYDEYLQLEGATDEQLEAFERKFDIRLPEDIKTVYRYKNGSGWFPLFFPDDKCNREFKYRLLSLEEMEKEKECFQNKNALLSEFYSYDEDDDYTKKLLKRMEDTKVKPYLLNEKWFPFAETLGDISLMMDFDPHSEGVYGQIICYIHDPDEIAYVDETISRIIDTTLLNIDFN